MAAYSTAALSGAERREREQQIEAGIKVALGRSFGQCAANGMQVRGPPLQKRRRVSHRTALLGTSLERHYPRRELAHWEALSVRQQDRWELDLGPDDIVECLLWDELHEELVLGTHFGRDISPCSHMLMSGRVLTAHPRHDERWFHPDGSLLTSLSMSENYLVSTALGGAGSSGSICLLSQGRDGDSDGDGSGSPVPPFTTLFEPRGKSVWCSAIVERSRHQPLVCAGATNSAFLLEAHDGCHGHQAPYATQSDVFATEFIDARTGRFALGCRSGDVLLFDPRVQASDGVISGRPATPTGSLRHGTSVTHVKALPGDERYIVVSGMEDSLALYDLRFSKSIGQHSSHRARSRGRSGHGLGFGSGPPTSPVLTYNGYVNLHTIRHGFAFKGDDMSSFAIASSTGTVKMFATYTGEELRGPLADRSFGQTVKALQWTRRGGLFAAAGASVEYWSSNPFQVDIDAALDQ